MPNKKQVVFNDFRGGLNIDTAIDHVQPNELIEAVNVDYSERGSIKTRSGTAKLNQDSYEGNVTQIFEWNKADGTTQLFAIIDKELYEIDEVGNKTHLQELISDRVSYFFLQNKVYFTDGGRYKTYDGESVEELSLSPITVRTFPTSSDVSAEPGTYRFVIVFRNTLGQRTTVSEVAEITITERRTFIVENLPEVLSDTKYIELWASQSEYEQGEWTFVMGRDRLAKSISWSGSWEYKGWIIR